MSYQQMLRRKPSTRVVVKVVKVTLPLIELAILILIVILALTDSAHASVNQLSTRVSADSCPASNDTQWRPWAQKWHRIAVKERRTLVRHVEALGLGKMPRKVPTIRDWTVTFTTTDPLTGETTVTTFMTWHGYGDANKRAAKAYRTRTTRLHHRLTRPGGGGAARWWPLASYCGWRPAQKAMLLHVIWRESSARPRAYNPSGAAGLLQTMSGWYRGQWGIPAFDPFDPEENLRAGYLIWKRCGWTPWAL